MRDQAAGLRSAFARRRPSLLIVAGADPCKAAVAVHFAREAAARLRATVLIDGTAGLAAAACDLAGRYELAHVLAGDKTLDDVAWVLAPNLLLVPAARALSRRGSFTADEEARLASAFGDGIAAALVAAGATGPQVDQIVVNAGEADAVRAVEAFGRDARVVIVASDHAASLRGAYLDIKALVEQQELEDFEIVVPRFDGATTPGVAFRNLAGAARRFLGIELTDGGTVRLPARCASVRDALPAMNPRPSIDAHGAALDLVLDSAPDPDPPSTHDDEVHHAAAVA